MAQPAQEPSPSPGVFCLAGGKQMLYQAVAPVADINVRRAHVPPRPRTVWFFAKTFPMPVIQTTGVGVRIGPGGNAVDRGVNPQHQVRILIQQGRVPAGSQHVLAIALADGAVLVAGHGPAAGAPV